MPSLNNYTFTNVQYTIPEGTDVVSLYPTAQITIVPNSGYTANAADFSLDPSFSDNAVQSVVFTQDGLNVLCTVTFDTGFVMPSGNYTIPLCVVGQSEVALIIIEGTFTANVGPNISGDVNESVPYASSGNAGELELLFTKNYTADPGYYLTSTGLQVVAGNASNYNIVQAPTYDGDNNLTGISYAVNYLYPNQSIYDDELRINQVSANEIFVAPQYITSYSSLPGTVNGFGQEVTGWRIYGGEGASVTATLVSANHSAIICSDTIDSSGFISADILFPSIAGGSSAIEVYQITLTGDLDPDFSQANPVTIWQSTMIPRIAFTATTTGNITGFTPVVKTSSAFSDFQNGPQVVNIQWTLTSPDTLVVDQVADAVTLTNVGSVVVTTTAASTNSPTITVDDTSNVVVGSKFSLSGTDRGVYDYEITGVNSPTEISVSPNITIANDFEIFAYTNNGNKVDDVSFSMTENSDGSITFNAEASIYYFGAADTTFTFLLDNLVKEIPSIACASSAVSGGEGITDYSLSLDPTGGVIAFLVNGQGLPDKFEILHGGASGDKKATSSMSASGNFGPFDNVFGTEPNNLIPTSAQLNADQFIGSYKYAPSPFAPSRTSEFFNDTGFIIPSMTVGGTTYQQVVWWQYTAADYTSNPNATMRITGPSGTGWDILRVCCLDPSDPNCTLPPSP
jgi:hypothetical protein